MARGILPCLALTCALCAAPAALSAPAQPEDAVKAAFVYNFAKFVDWPEAALARGDGRLDICVLGETPFAPALREAVRGKIVQGRTIEVRENVPLGETASCNILYIPGSQRARMSEVLERVGHLPVLTVGDADALAESGGMIGLRTEENRVRFDINLLAARKAGLKLGSQLLRVATRLIGGEAQP